MPAYARRIADQSGGNIAEIEELPLEVLEAEASPSREYLRELERLHKGIVTYLWLSYRFAGIFTTRALAFHIKSMVEEKIEDVLSKFSFSEAARKKVAAARQKQLLLDLSEAARLEDAAVENAESEAAEQENDNSVLSAGQAEVTSEGDSKVESDDFAASAHDLDDQTSLSAGGDHFAGEVDMALEDSAEAEVASELNEGKPQSNRSAQWPEQRAQVEGQSSDEQNADRSSSTSEAAAEGERAGASAARGKDVLSSESADTSSNARPHDLPADIETSDDGLPTETSQAPGNEQFSESATAPPDARLKEDLAGKNAPTQHLHAHIGIDPAADVERNVRSRP